MLFDHRLRRVCLSVVLAAVLCLAGGLSLQAQTTSASVSGTVKDAQGGVMPGASVTLTSDTKGTVQTVVTDGLGNFLFPFVVPDTYTLKITLQGFQTTERPKLVVNANDRLAAGTSRCRRPGRRDRHGGRAVAGHPAQERRARLHAAVHGGREHRGQRAQLLRAGRPRAGHCPGPTQGGGMTENVDAGPAISPRTAPGRTPTT